ncbi:hypothetical protein LA080_008261 [Diaporthe eres]|nr:hypothetical protein LA080_008261 [Diaporthe eres]
MEAVHPIRTAAARQWLLGRTICPTCLRDSALRSYLPSGDPHERSSAKGAGLRWLSNAEVAQLRNGGSNDQKKPGSASSFPPIRPRGSDEGREEPISTGPPQEQHSRLGEGRSTAEPYIPNQSPPSAGLVEDVPSPFAPHIHATYTAEYFSALISDFESYTYPVNPIITSEQIRTCIDLMSIDATRAALVYSFAAVTINLTMTQQKHTHKLSINFINSNGFGMPITTSERIHDLMNHSLRAKGRATPTDALSDNCLSDDLIEIQIATCIFLEICWMAFKKPKHAFLVLREAIALIQLLHVDRGPGTLTAPEYARRQRIYWEANGQRTEDHTIPINIDAGFRRIIKLFLILDDDLLANWMAQNYNAADPLSCNRLEKDGVTVEWIEQKQQQVDDEEAEVEAEQQRLEGTPAALTELQLADLFITRAWLRTIVWQLAMSDFLLSSGPTGSERHEALSLFFPAHRLSAQLRKLAQFQVETSIGKHGSGILQKIFEIANTIADVMTLFPVASTGTRGGEESGELLGHDESESPGFDQSQARQCMADLLLLVKVLLSFERIDKTQRDIILSKVETLKIIFPGMDFASSLPVQ